MKNKIIISPKFLKFFTGNFASALAFFPFIILRKKEFATNPVLINHEMIHLRQQVELLLIFFYCWYLTEYIIRLIIYRNHLKAYRNISFEREAYANENNIYYNKQKKWWSFLKYIN